MLDLKSHYLGTYAKMLVQDWQSLTRFIQQQTRRVSETIHNEFDAPIESVSTLTDHQINDALNGPYQTFYVQHLSALSHIARVETALTITKGEFFKDEGHIENQRLSVPEKILNQIDFPDLKQMRSDLNSLFETHRAELESAINQWTQLLLDNLNQNPSLSDLEITAFKTNEAITEIHDQYIDLKVELPHLDKSAFNFMQYFTLKATLAIHSALSRLHKPNGTKDIHAVLKTLHDSLKTIRKSEEALLKMQLEKISGLILKIKF